MVRPSRRSAAYNSQPSGAVIPEVAEGFGVVLGVLALVLATPHRLEVCVVVTLAHSIKVALIERGHRPAVIQMPFAHVLERHARLKLGFDVGAEVLQGNSEILVSSV